MLENSKLRLLDKSPVSSLVETYVSSNNINNNSPPQQFTKRETEVLTLLIQGKTNKQIGKELYISVETVKFHIENLFRKTNVQCRTALVYNTLSNMLNANNITINNNAWLNTSSD